MSGNSKALDLDVLGHQKKKGALENTNAFADVMHPKWSSPLRLIAVYERWEGGSGGLLVCG